MSNYDSIPDELKSLPQRIKDAAYKRQVDYYGSVLGKRYTC